MSSVFTCKAKLGAKQPFVQYSKDSVSTVEQVQLQFFADYNDDANKAWSKYTPALSFNMTVIPEVAEGMEIGQNYTVTFEPEIVDTECTCTDEMACSSCVKN